MSVLIDTFVPVDLIDELKEKINTIQKRAARVHFPIPSIEYLEVVTGNSFGHNETPSTPERLDFLRREGRFAEARREAPMDWRHIVISGEPLKLNGWRLVAAIDGIVQKDETQKAYFRPVVGQEIPEAYRETDPYICEHCGLRRWRTETFLVGHEDGSFKQVGRQCIRDFLGWNPDSLVPYLKLWHSMKDWFESDFGPRTVPTYSPEEVVITAARIVAHDGFYQSVAKQQAAAAAEDYENNWSTKQRTLDLLDPPINAEHKREFHDVYNDEQYDELAARIHAETLIGIEELLAQDAKSDWAWSLQDAWNAKYLKRHQMGVMASSVILGLKRIEATKEKKEIAAGPVSEHVGQIGDKVATTVTVTDVRFVESMYGSSSLIQMVDDNGNLFKTFYSGTKADPIADQRIDIRGTVKKHDEYKGRKETVLTRYKWEPVK